MMRVPCHKGKQKRGVGRKVRWTLTFIKAGQSRDKVTQPWGITLELMAQEKEHVIEPMEEK